MNCKHELVGEKNLWTFEHGEKVRVEKLNGTVEEVRLDTISFPIAAAGMESRAVLPLC